MSGPPTMSNPHCAQVDSRPSPVPASTVGLFEGAHPLRWVQTPIRLQNAQPGRALLRCLLPGNLEPD